MVYTTQRTSSSQGYPPGEFAPPYPAPSYGSPSYGPSGYDTPNPSAPAHAAPAHAAPTHGASGYGAPAHHAPGYGAPYGSPGSPYGSSSGEGFYGGEGYGGPPPSPLMDPTLLRAARHIYRQFYEVHPDSPDRPVGVAINRYSYRGKLIFGKRPILLPQECLIPFEQIQSELY